MGALVVTQNSTVDGVIEATDDWFATALSEGDDDLNGVLAAQRDASTGFLAGRDTYLAMRESWGRMTDDTTGVADHLNRVQKYVVSTTLDPADIDWDPTTVLRSVEDVAAAKVAHDGEIVCTGSISVARALSTAGLVDEFRLFVYPFARGRGARLFDATPPAWLRLAECRSFASGALLLRYRTG